MKKFNYPSGNPGGLSFLIIIAILLVLPLIIICCSDISEQCKDLKNNDSQPATTLSIKGDKYAENDKIICDYIYRLPLDEVKEVYDNIPAKELVNLSEYMFNYNEFISVPKLKDFNVYVLNSIHTIYNKKTTLSKAYYFIIARVNACNNKYLNDESNANSYQGTLPLKFIRQRW